MNHLSSEETDKFIFQFLDHFKMTNPDEVISLIKDNNIDPQHSEQIISDYAALWLKEPEIIKFFKDIKNIGGNPIGHPSVMKNCISQGKLQAIQYLIDEGVLKELPCDIVYFINVSIMSNQTEAFKLLMQHIDITVHKQKHEKNPSFVNRIVEYLNTEILDLVLKENLIQPYLFSNETINHFKGSFDPLGLKAMFIDKILDNLEIKNKNQYVLGKNDNLEDVYEIFKKIEFTLLDRSLEKKNGKKIKAKI